MTSIILIIVYIFLLIDTSLIFYYKTLKIEPLSSFLTLLASIVFYKDINTNVGRLILCVSMMLYSSTAYRYNLIGDSMSTMIVYFILFINYTYRMVMKINKKDLDGLKKHSFIVFIIIATISIVSIRIIIRWLDVIGSVYPELESIGIISLIIGSYFDIIDCKYKWIFYLLRNTINLYMWTTINDRIHIEILWCTLTIITFVRVIYLIKGKDNV